MSTHRQDSRSFDGKLIAYSTAVGASFVMGHAAQADIIYYEGPWTGTGTDVPLVSFNLAGDVATDGTHVADEQFFFGNQGFAGTGTVGGGGGGPTFGTILKPGGGGGGTAGFTVAGNSLFVQGAGDAGALIYPGGTGFFPGVDVPPALPIPVTYQGYDILLSPTAIIIDAGPYTKPAPASFGSRGALGVNAQVQATNTTTLIPPSLKTALPGGIPGLPGKGGTTKAPTVGAQTFATGIVPFGSDALIGLRFDAPGDEFFMGWAGITLNSIDSITLTGYAYEDSGGPILLGDTGRPPIETPEPSTLSLFALGATGLAILRRRRRPDPSEVMSDGPTVH